MMTTLWHAAGTHGLGAAELLDLFLHFALISLVAIGGAISTAADMHRYLVVQQGWMDDGTFLSSIAIAQAAPGPNVLFVAVLGWNAAGVLGLLATMVGILLPSTLLTMMVSRWGAQRPDALWVRAVPLGLGPLTIGLLLSTGWVLTEPVRAAPAAWVLVIATVIVMTRTRLSPLWMIGVGGLVGALGWV